MTLFKKSNLLIAMMALTLASVTQAKILHPLVVNSDSLQWSDAAELPPGAKVAILSGNPKKNEPFVARLKLPANYYIPVHSHPINEYDTVISGALYLGLGNKHDLDRGKELTVGSFALIPAGMLHSSWTKEETILQINGVGPWGMIYYKRS